MIFIDEISHWLEIWPNDNIQIDTNLTLQASCEVELCLKSTLYKMVSEFILIKFVRLIISPVIDHPSLVNRVFCEV